MLIACILLRTVAEGQNLAFGSDFSLITSSPIMFSTKVGAVARNIATSAARLYEKPHHGPGSNLPFSFHNHYKFVAVFTIFTASGLAVPFWITRYQLLK